MFKRILLIVLDSVGVGALPDADQYGDEGANTLAHISDAVGGLAIPHLVSMGMGQVADVPVVSPQRICGAYGRMAERSAGKDTTNGHWEMMGVTLDKPLPTYPDGFPKQMIETLEKLLGVSVLGNRPASGTDILRELGKEHVQTGSPIVYTSADSVLQIAAHEDVVPLERLYDMCAIARNLFTGDHGVGRVIARPFRGDWPYVRTENRKDYSLSFGRTILEELVDNGIPVIGIGKIGDIYGHRGITEAVHTSGNDDGMDQTISWMDRIPTGVIFSNLVDFDMLYGHRNDPVGFARAIEAFDARLPEIFARLQPTDLLIITADHGCDPTTEGTDHTREYVPILAYHSSMRCEQNLGVRSSFADLGATIAANFNVSSPAGNSFLSTVLSP